MAPSIFNGIELCYLSTDPSILSDLNSGKEHEGLQHQREFYSPVRNAGPNLKTLPDFRNVLYWSPDIHTDAQGKAEVNFFTSDLKGKYIAVLQGMNVSGRVGERSVLFEVK